MKLKQKNENGLWAQFKKFINRGNVVDLSVAVIIGGAFQAIVNALVNGILMPIISWAIPSGGINGIVTVLNGGSSYICEASDTVSIAAATAAGTTTVQYWGKVYDSAKVNVINWGGFINAVIYFLIVAIVLFIILQVFTYLKKKRLQFEAKELEKYYEKHPEERPAPEPEPAPVIKEPTEVELLQDIKDQLVKLNADKESK